MWTPVSDYASTRIFSGLHSGILLEKNSGPKYTTTSSGEDTEENKPCSSKRNMQLAGEALIAPPQGWIVHAHVHGQIPKADGCIAICTGNRDKNKGRKEAKKPDEAVLSPGDLTILALRRRPLVFPCGCTSETICCRTALDGFSHSQPHPKTMVQEKSHLQLALPAFSA
ncbi:hypothetical protein MAP00_001226 [Monascus purpureus]|nr:hypothetical protein MAP00_001226 [Monascus purpureus]